MSQNNNSTIKKNRGPQKEAYLNKDIPFNKVFLISSDGEKLGVYERDKALELAREERKDLVLITTQPKPVVRILDYGKFKYDKKRREKELKEKQTVVKNHQIRLTPLIDENDLAIKARKAREFLLEGDRVKLSLKFRGRELSRQDIGHDTLKRFFALVEDVAKIDKEAALNAGRFLDMVIHPDKKKIAKYLKNNENAVKTKDSNENLQTNDEEDEQEN
ncbi:translation initiation factor IF-3 [Mycoplasmopsis agassizii]|uniref:Translation initiation factor IF-3 n=1 Tax=Mycoplasmopsis agassizii TaxID=33922 RepID=A0ABX4H463_9BACT|nr:translation initiation factor IF-3 [Mycoplasmopsis agassizii]PAF54682.1 translation initiation factor IF-3 [Mycoplasmopsis agassizii]SMC16067.1 bacterial translation initiation factor 3 (bIF-3) [Mycoplasmopsis agassizii]